MDLLRDLYARFRVLIHEVAKFGLVGVLAFVITLGGANVLHYGAGLGPLTSVTIATVVATVFAFLGNKLWAFRHRNGSHWGRDKLMGAAHEPPGYQLAEVNDDIAAGISLLWPFSDHSLMLSHTGYLVVMGLFAAVAAVRCRQGAYVSLRSRALR